MDDPTPIAIAIELCPDNPGQYRWHLRDAEGVSVRTAPESYASAEDARAAAAAALGSFGAARDG